jgi:hypothetical protein
MAAMTSTTRRRAGRVRGATVVSWPRWALVLATLVGLVVMHQLAGGPHPVDHPHAAGAATVLAAHPPCPPGQGQCPDDPHGHPGQVCQPGTPSASTGTAAPAQPSVRAVPATPVAPVSPRTAAGEAGHGSGCGPPSLTLLSISRT